MFDRNDPNSGRHCLQAFGLARVAGHRCARFPMLSSGAHDETLQCYFCRDSNVLHRRMKIKRYQTIVLPDTLKFRA
jgi:hypothetical protein